MNDLLKKAIQKQPEFQSLRPSVQSFLLEFFELFSQEYGTRESNKYFAQRLGISISGIETRFKDLRDNLIIRTDLNQYFDPVTANNKRGFVTIRTNYLDPTFKARVFAEVDSMKKFIINYKLEKDRQNDRL